MSLGHNLFVSYDLHDPSKNYAAVSEAIKKLGNWAKPNLSFWYVDSGHSAEQAAKIVWAAMDSNDKLIVIDAKLNTAYWYNLDSRVDAYLKANWNF